MRTATVTQTPRFGALVLATVATAALLLSWAPSTPGPDEPEGSERRGAEQVAASNARAESLRVQPCGRTTPQRSSTHVGPDTSPHHDAIVLREYRGGGTINQQDLLAGLEVESDADPQPQAEPPAVTTSITLDNQLLGFRLGSTENSPAGHHQLRHLVNALATVNQPLCLLIIGHSSPDGPLQLNEDLARDRARSVYDGLPAAGLPDGTCVQDIGCGIRHPVAAED